MQLAFNLEAWMETGADNNLPGEEAVQQGKEYINKAIDIFTEVCAKDISIKEFKGVGGNLLIILTIMHEG